MMKRRGQRIGSYLWIAGYVGHSGYKDLNWIPSYLAMTIVAPKIMFPSSVMYICDFCSSFFIITCC